MNFGSVIGLYTVGHGDCCMPSESGDLGSIGLRITWDGIVGVLITGEGVVGVAAEVGIAEVDAGTACCILSISACRTANCCLISAACADA